MSQRDRLRLLKVCKTRHVSIQILLHNIKDRPQKVLQQSVSLPDLVPDVQLHVKSDLVVAASPCVKLLAGLTDPVDQMRFHKAVNVLIFRRKLKPA